MTMLVILFNKALGVEIIIINLMLNPVFQTCPPFQSAVTEEFIKWVWLGLKAVIIVKMMVKIQKRTINSSKIHRPLAQGLV